MPITPKYTWSQTTSTVEIKVQLHGLTTNKGDVFATSSLVKINNPPYLLLIDLYKDVVHEKSTAVIVPDGVVFQLQKVDHEEWPQLNVVGNKVDITKRRNDSIENAYARMEQERQARTLRKNMEDKQATQRLMDLDRRKRREVEGRKQAELDEERRKIADWKESGSKREVGREGRSEGVDRWDETDEVDGSSDYETSDEEEEDQRASRDVQEARKKEKEKEKEEKKIAQDHPDYYGRGWRKNQAGKGGEGGDKFVTQWPGDEGKGDRGANEEEEESEGEDAGGEDAESSNEEELGREDNQSPNATNNGVANGVTNHLSNRSTNNVANKSFVPFPPPRLALGPVAVQFTKLQTQHLPAREQREEEIKVFRKQQQVLDQKILEDSDSLADRQPMFLKDKGDALYKKGDVRGALNAYSRGIDFSALGAAAAAAANELSWATAVVEESEEGGRGAEEERGKKGEEKRDKKGEEEKEKGKERRDIKKRGTTEEGNQDDAEEALVTLLIHIYHQALQRGSGSKVKGVGIKASKSIVANNHTDTNRHPPYLMTRSMAAKLYGRNPFEARHESRNDDEDSLTASAGYDDALEATKKLIKMEACQKLVDAAKEAESKGEAVLWANRAAAHLRVGDPAAAAADASVAVRMMNLTGQKQRILNDVKLTAVMAVQGSDATSSTAEEEGIEPAANVAVASKTLYVKALVRRAQALLDLGLLKPALDDYRLALRMDPNNESLRRGREELEASIDLLDTPLYPSRNLDDPSENSNFSFASGSGSKERGVTSSSLTNSTLAEVRQIESRDLGILRKRGDARFKSGDAEGALEAFNLAVQGIVRQIRILDREKEELPVNSTLRNSLDSDRKALEWELLAAMSNGGACLLLMERFVSCVTRCTRAIALLLLLVAPPKNSVENTASTISNDFGGISSSLDRRILDAVLKDDGDRFSEEDLQILGGNFKEEASPLATGDFLAGAAWDTSALARWAEKGGWIQRCEMVEKSRNSTELREKDSCKINIVPDAGLSTPMAIKTLGSFWRLISRRSSALGHLKLFSKAAADLELGLRSIIMSLRLRCGSCVAEFDSHFGEFLLCERQGSICKAIDLDKVLRCLDKCEARQIEDIKPDLVAEGKKIRVCVRDIKKLKELQDVDSK